MDAGERVVDAASAAPTAALRRFARRYVGYRYLGFPPGVHRGLPSPYLTLVVSLDQPTRIAISPDGPDTGHAGLVGGMHTSAVSIRHDGSSYGVQIELTPLGARWLLGVPAGELAFSVVDLDDLLGPVVAGLADRLAAQPGWPARFAVLDEVLARRARRLGGPARQLAYAWRRIGESRGVVRVGDLAAEVGWSRRNLGGRFRAEFGLTPKDAARVMRFEGAKRALRTPGRRSLAALAADCGYYDQSHLVREWRDMVGLPPSGWLASEDLPVVGTPDGN